MKTLRFIAAEALISIQEYAKMDIRNIAHNLYPLLLKACFLHEKEEIINILVENWPLQDFNFGKLMGKTVDCPEDISHWACQRSITACLKGLKNYVLNCSPTYSKRLKVVDLTGIRDVQFQPCKCKKTLGRWARTQLISQICFELLIEMQMLEFSPFVFEVDVDIMCNLFVTEKTYELVVQALLMRCHSPLKIRCVDFRADSLALRKLFYIIRLAEPSSIRKLEMVHNVRLEVYHLEVLLNNITFTQLSSLTLPARTFNVINYTAEDEAVLCTIGEKLSHMVHLTELSLSFSTLTGRLRKLLSPLKTPLKVLELANCSLNQVDMAYLANSLHAEYLEELDMSGHNITDLFPSMFLKLLSKASQTLKVLILEECAIGDMNIHILEMGIVHCLKLKEFKFLGNPIIAIDLRRLFRLLANLPVLRYIEFPVPKDCYPPDVSYPLDEVTLIKYDLQKYETIKQTLCRILRQAAREDILVATPLFGSYDSAIEETSSELGACLLSSFKDALESFTAEIQKL
ncbi:PREDICTED: leucine-rich repeat-containing protein 14B [Nanorana parkeri]|uniref:leucine-rich repeat-containing protein 14B n=1 Tax=Nanorana parkeri TaxID=125878 RepID=UPI000853F8C1|nr:PREDICTED: leucine-rich repeat-containing protein 14B [Nanorana parkeri]